MNLVVGVIFLYIKYNGKDSTHPVPTLLFNFMLQIAIPIPIPIPMPSILACIQLILKPHAETSTGNVIPKPRLLSIALSL